MGFRESLQLAAATYGDKEFDAKSFAMVAFIYSGKYGRDDLEKTKSQRIKKCSNELDRLYRMGFLNRKEIKRLCLTKTGKSCCRGRCYKYRLSANGRQYVKYLQEDPYLNLAGRALDSKFNIAKNPIAHNLYMKMRRAFPKSWTFDSVCIKILLYAYPELRYGRQRRFLPRIDEAVFSALSDLIRERAQQEVRHLPVEKAQKASEDAQHPVTGRETLKDVSRPNWQVIEISKPAKDNRLPMSWEDLAMIFLFMDLQTKEIKKLEKLDAEHLDYMHLLQDNIPWRFIVDERGRTAEEKRKARRESLRNVGFSEKEIEGMGDLSEMAPVELHITKIKKVIYETISRAYKENMSSQKTREVTIHPQMFERITKVMQGSKNPLRLRVENGAVTDFGRG